MKKYKPKNKTRRRVIEHAHHVKNRLTAKQKIKKGDFDTIENKPMNVDWIVD